MMMLIDVDNKDPLDEKKKLELRAMRFAAVGGQQQQQEETE
jgi:hypothetical protein